VTRGYRFCSPGVFLDLTGGGFGAPGKLCRVGPGIAGGVVGDVCRHRGAGSVFLVSVRVGGVASAAGVRDGLVPDFVAEGSQCALNVNGSGKNFFDDFGAIDGEQFVTIVMAENQVVLIDAKGMEDGGVKVVRVDGAFDGGITDGVGGADDLAAFDAATGQPHGIA
jgi:hypothetical protein